VLLTAIPLSLRQIAATNAPAVSSILWEEFLDESRPQWFLNLPYDIQSYLVKEFGPSTAWLPAPPQTTDGDAFGVGFNTQQCDPIPAVIFFNFDKIVR
jgi:hypothetical protein